MRKMKNSGIDWIGDIPDNWIICSLGNIIETIKNGYSETQLNEETDFIVTRIESISKGFINLDKIGFVDWSADLEKHRLVFGDILFSNINSLAKIGNIAQYTSGERIYNGMNLLKITPNRNYCYRWVYYVMLSSYFKSFVSAYAKPAINQASIPAQKIRSIPIPLPPPQEQQAIADFLDKKCLEIDSLITNVKTQIEVLEEYKKSVITETVTKGLDKNVQMKDSGIEWIGVIPVGWELHQVLYYFMARKNKNVLEEEKNLLSLSYGKIKQKDINANGGLLPENFNTYNIIEKNDIVLRLTDLQNDKKSLRTALSTQHGIITSAYITLKPIKDINSNYHHYLLHSYDIKKVFYNMGNGVRQSLTYSELSKLMLINPPIETQNEIVKYLDEKCSIIDNTITSKLEQITTLEEYKKSFIFEYVTGKKEVGGSEI